MIENFNYTNEQVRNIMRNERVDYAVSNFMTVEDIQDLELRELCANMKESRDKVEQFMVDKFGEDWQTWEDKK